MCERGINKSCTKMTVTKVKPCDHEETNMHTSGCKRRTFISKHCKSLVMGYRKYYPYSMPTKISHSFLNIKNMVSIFLISSFMLVAASEEYNRLSISDTRSFMQGHNADLYASLWAIDYRHVSHEELLNIGNGFDNFTDPGVTHFSEILFDFDHYQVRNPYGLIIICIY